MKFKLDYLRMRKTRKIKHGNESNPETKSNKVQRKGIPLNIENNMFREWVLVRERKIEDRCWWWWRCSSMVRERNQEAKPDNANASLFLKIMDPHHHKPYLLISLSYYLFFWKDQPSKIRNSTSLNMVLWGIVQIGFI